PRLLQRLDRAPPDRRRRDGLRVLSVLPDRRAVRHAPRYAPAASSRMPVWAGPSTRARRPGTARGAPARRARTPVSSSRSTFWPIAATDRGQSVGASAQRTRGLIRRSAVGRFFFGAGLRIDLVR